MKLTRTVEFHLVWPALVSLVNVLFLVVLFFALSSSFVFQPGIRVQLPASPFALRPQQNPTVVTLEPGHPAAVWYREQKLSLPEFAKVLGSKRDENRTVIIRADSGVRYESLVELMNTALHEGVSVVLATEEEKE